MNATMRSGQDGSMLLEAFIAILIFSVGILAIVGMQTSAIQATSDAKYRTDASVLANELLGQMWNSDRNPANMRTNFQGGGGTDGAAYTAWLANVQATLPGVAASPPTVVVDTATSQVTITVNWKLPSEPDSAPTHRYMVMAQVR